MPTNTLAYFTEFLQNFNERMDDVSAKIAQLDTRVSERIVHVEDRVTVVESSVKNLADRNIFVDNAEILVCGLPKNMQLSQSDIASRLYNALGLPPFSNFIVTIRFWNGPDLVPLQNVPNMQAQNSQTVNITPNPNFFALVIKLNSTIVRDEIILRTPALKEKSIATIFDVPGNSMISCRALRPREVYQLYK
ncbi:hypothetical protein QAD02_013763 [Eretmocerus hayati]|uniref:Uncharacterized protein n=1 Tax=Eretmocerus hayati TaxID=131215 RepID=A0ACC2P3G0_9HYME|nr:hypothetical protein QAD02_013763 [Eretmocerus hayati]